MLNQDSTRSFSNAPPNAAAAAAAANAPARVPLRQHQRHPFLQDLDRAPLESQKATSNVDANKKSGKILFEDEEDDDEQDRAPQMDRAALEAHGRRVIIEAAAKAAASTKPPGAARPIEDVHLLSKDHARLETHRLAAQKVAQFDSE